MARNDRLGGDTVTGIRTDTTKEALIGTDHGSRSNVSWGAVIAGVMTFLAVTVLLSLVTVGIGLTGSGVGAGIWSVIALALALAAAGYVAGALAVRSGLLHGFLTWATSLVVALALTVWLGASLLGAVGGVVGTVASSASEALSGTDTSQVVEDAQGSVSEEDMQQAEDQANEAIDDAQQTAEEAGENVQAGAWWGFAGLLLGAIIAAGGGVFGVRSVISRRETTEVSTVRTRA